MRKLNKAFHNFIVFNDNNGRDERKPSIKYFSKVFFPAAVGILVYFNCRKVDHSE